MPNVRKSSAHRSNACRDSQRCGRNVDASTFALKNSAELWCVLARNDFAKPAKLTGGSNHSPFDQHST
ncbi:hypothetical protein X963_5344 [Burkholderia pseudomallei MSHR7498]|nr:hypothetical protein X963_5344 [Burkholderia pseudomallei MSHR7498]